ncbi:MAG: type II toxin-antitoxin system Phd/YefM family antitoxin [Anaerolineaceae bacterium]|nr:type II toxin-antitoxin system Phd/YefM family antitoxin [Anaerolineaceae bacterium]
MYQALTEEIRPSADLRNHYPEISKACRENRSAVIITVNGRGDTVTIGYPQYQEMKARLELLEILAESEQDVRNGNVAPMRDTINTLRSQLLNGEF